MEYCIMFGYLMAFMPSGFNQESSDLMVFTLSRFLDMFWKGGRNKLVWRGEICMMA